MSSPGAISATTRATLDEAGEQIARLRESIAQIVLGKDQEIELVCVALLARGHLLLEDVPGVGKTTLAHALARSLGGEFRRVQFTADLLPSDILGVSIFDPDRREFEFRPGPIFGNVVLADELNRGMPKTQGALLEAMSEGQVSTEGRTLRLPDPFLLIATENPIEHLGTFPLPESQLDRFLMRLPIGYPPREAERRIVQLPPGADLVERLEPALELEEVRQLRQVVDEVHCSEQLIDYLLSIVERSREDRMLRLGVSPRGAQLLLRGARALALVEGRRFVLPEDVQNLAVPVLGHRVVLREELDATSTVQASEAVIRRLLDEVPVPV